MLALLFALAILAGFGFWWLATWPVAYARASWDRPRPTAGDLSAEPAARQDPAGEETVGLLRCNRLKDGGGLRGSGGLLIAVSLPFVTP